MRGAIGAALVMTLAAAAAGQPVVLDRAEYEDRLRGMWLGEAIANWTGLRTEGRRIEPPFFTDADWGTTPPDGGPPIGFVLDQDPWGADDDTDIEYVYLHLLDAHGAAVLTPRQIADGWTAHINRSIWVSNAAARALIGRGVVPPVTGMGAANELRLMIDAQLTTEFFGALCPGMPRLALEMADLPIRTTASGYAAHAAQFFVALYALAPVADASLPAAERVRWMVLEARRLLPEGSKAAEIVDFVVADHLANPDPEDWERTRDRIYERFQRDAWAHGYVYRGWYESGVNLGTGVMALLYGRGDYLRTVQIGTLSGWDADNPTATMGGVLGLMLGYDELVAQFPGQSLSDRFWILRTRDGLPDRTPGEPGEDTFALMAARMMPIVERKVIEGGGNVGGGEIVLPALEVGGASLNPLVREQGRSANQGVRSAGGTVVAASSVGWGAPPWGSGVGDPGRIANGFESDHSGREPNDLQRWYFSSQGAAAGPGVVTLSVVYDRPVRVERVRFIEGEHFAGGAVEGGWFDGLSFELLVGGEWVAAEGVVSEAPEAARPFQLIEVELAVPVVVTGVRVSGVAGGAGAFVTCAELDLVLVGCGADVDGNGSLTLGDFVAFRNLYVAGDLAADFDGSGGLTLADFVAFRNAYAAGCP